MTISLIAAIDLNNAIGYKNELLCKLPSDINHFKQLTTNNFIVMGRNTYDSIGKPLPNRTNIILTRNKKYLAPPGTFVYHSIEDVIHAYNTQNNGESDLFFIGGAEIYNQAIPYADRIYLTIIDHKFDNADAYFPRLSDEWKPVSNAYNPVYGNNPYDHYFVEYRRKFNRN